MSKPSGLMLGNIEVTKGDNTPSRIALLLWGPAGSGKTTFAATAPGTKLWISFGDNEHVSVTNRKDVQVADVSSQGVTELFNKVQNDNPLGLDTYLAQNGDVETVVVDSVTAIAFRALQKAVAERYGAGKQFSPTMEAPGIAAYGARNAIVLETITGFLRVTAKHNVHCIITAHEDDPTMREEAGKDVIDYIGVQLGGKLVNNMTWRLSEIWYLSESTGANKSRRLAIRPTRLRRPMKTRMFRGDQEAEFVLKYDALKPDKGQMTIASWHEVWSKDRSKLDVPGSK